MMTAPRSAWRALKDAAGSKTQAGSETPANSEAQVWDMIIVGGGITGVGILREATRRGLKALLVEQKDYAWGTSSRSSKMVHGGLRYIAQFDIKLTKHSVLERERLLREAPGLVNRLGYLFTIRKGQFPGKLIFNGLLAVYDSLAGIKTHDYFDNAALAKRVPGINTQDLKGASYYTDAVTDDARLVMRVLHAALAEGGQSINYCRAEEIQRDGGKVSGIKVVDQLTGESVVLKSRVIVNATGAWVDHLRMQMGHSKQIRPLRGSHLVIPRALAPVSDALTLFHPKDKRPVFLFPWEGATIIGTTDLDHDDDLNKEPGITQAEVDYLLDAARTQFTSANIGEKDVISTWAGVRPVISQDKNKDPSKESREHEVWIDQGLITVSGGKLTTFRLIALDVMQAAKPFLGPIGNAASEQVLSRPTINAIALGLADGEWAARLLGRYGDAAKAMFDGIAPNEKERIGNTQFCLAEARWAAQNEWVVHLDDLLLRRTRLGNLLPDGGASLLPALKPICQQALGWDDADWDAETVRYLALWHQSYSLPSKRRASAA